MIAGALIALTGSSSSYSSLPTPLTHVGCRCHTVVISLIIRSLCLVNGLVVHTTCDGRLAGQDVPVDDGSGTVQVWVVHDFKLEAVDPAK